MKAVGRKEQGHVFFLIRALFSVFLIGFTFFLEYICIY